MAQHKSIITSTDRSPGRPRLWLAAVDGVPLHSPVMESVAPADEPEAAMHVEFVGISRSQQLAAIAGFPGGRRFVLKD